MNYTFAFSFLFMHFLFFYMSFWCSTGISLMISFDLFEFLGEMLNLVFLFDWVSFLFLSAVSLITSVVIFYSIFYMGELSSYRFFFLLFLFVISMFFLIFSGNLLFMMLGWDGLGVISFALVIYYQNEVSVKSGLITIFINRFGDAAMVFFICFYFLNSMNFYLIGSDDLMIGLFLFLIGCFTKSAQFPFMSWLPAAMTAPTPISSLVHSSTLVTAGVYLLIRMNLFFYIEDFVFLTKILGLFTMGSGGIMALMELDFKKIVAFSTLSQLGLMVFVLSFGEWQLSFFHLLTHAIFKSFLFMIVGCVMTKGYGNQDSRLMGLNLKNSWVKSIFIAFACLNLSGFPLTMGFLSKDVILESFMIFNFDSLMLLMFLLFCCFTVSYSLKIYFLSVNEMKMGNSILMNYNFSSSLNGLIILFLFMSFWGLIMEELVVFDDMFAGDQDAKILDFCIILSGLFFYFMFKNLLYFNFFFMLVDFFWLSWFFLKMNLFYKSVSSLMNLFSFYYINFFMIDMFKLNFSSENLNYNLNFKMTKSLMVGFVFLNLIYFFNMLLIY